MVVYWISEINFIALLMLVFMGKKFIIFCAVFFISLTIRAQYFNTGEDPARLKWRVFSTLHFQLIYPESFEEQAQKLANYFELVYRYGNKTLNHSPRKISIIFHTQTIKSNGLVGWAPRRMEIFTPPHQAIYPQDWLEQLVMHEFRHVVQIEKIHSQIPGIVKLILGEQGSALITGAFLPFWFLEGDAVVTETALSNFGRGRLPSFLMEHKAQVLDKGVFTFDKAFNGSYRDFVPDHYKLGYHLVGESRARYGAQIWSNAIDRIATRPWSLTPLNRSLRQQIGMNQEQLYQSVFDSLRIAWSAEDLTNVTTKVDTLKSAGPRFSNFLYNHILPSGNIVTLKTGFDDVPHFLVINKDGQETKILTPGQILDASVGFRDNLAVWSEFVPDSRWTHSGRTQIKILDIENNSVTSFFPEYKCFAPAISPGKQYIAVVEVNFENNYFLSVYNAATGALIKRYQTPGNNYLFSPAWKDDSELAVVVLSDQGKELAMINPFMEKMEPLLSAEMGDIKHLRFHAEDLYFISNYSGRDELWKISHSSKAVTRISKARFGHAYPAIGPDGLTVLLSDYTADGYQLISSGQPYWSEESISEVAKGEYLLAGILADQEPGVVNFKQADTLNYNSKPYRKWQNLFKIHSWAPLVLDIDSYEVQPGISLVSQNLLGTTESTFGYKWNTSEKTGQYFANFLYRGWYPIIGMEIESGKSASDFNIIQVYKDPDGNIVSQDTIMKRVSWNQKTLSINSRVPLILTRGAFFRLLQPEIKYALTTFAYDSSAPDNFEDGNIQTISYRLYYHQIKRQAYRDVLPDWGIITDVYLRNSPMGKSDVGRMLAGQVRTYLPGLSGNHGTSLYAGTQQRERGSKYRFSDAIRMPRGWNSIMSNQLLSTSAEYRLPLFYPDINLGRWIYFRRVKAAVFADYAWLSGDVYKNGEITGSFNKEISSIGVDLTSDINLLRFYAPVNAGFRMAYMPEMKDGLFEFLFSIDFTSF